MTTHPDKVDPEKAVERMRAAAERGARLRPPEPTEEEVAAIAAAERSRRLAAFDARVPDKLRGGRMGDFEPPRYHETIKAGLVEWSTHTDGRNLVLLGPIGTGKSRAAFAAMRPAAADGQHVEFWPMIELLDALKAEFDADGPARLLDRLVDVDVLMLDDVGAEKLSEWSSERLYRIVNHRWLYNLPTVVTSNLPPDEIEAEIGPRTFSRLVGDAAVVLALRGDDHRRSP